MTENIIKPQDHPDIVSGWVWTTIELKWINERIAKAVAYEREACAQVCEANHGTVNRNMDSFDCAKAIRARGNQC